MNLSFVKSTFMTVALGCAALLAPSIADAQSFVRVQQNTPILSGPGYGYPQVAVVRFNENLRLHGCLQEIAWCDVEHGFVRGWIAADSLIVSRGNQYYPLYQSRTWFTYPIVSFIFADYWNRHYRHSSWYGHRDRYSNWDWRRHSHRWNDGRRNDWRNDDRERRHGDYRNDRRWDHRTDRDHHDRDRNDRRNRRHNDATRPERIREVRTDRPRVIQSRPVDRTQPHRSDTLRPIIHRSSDPRRSEQESRSRVIQRPSTSIPARPARPAYTAPRPVKAQPSRSKSQPRERNGTRQQIE